MFKFNCHNYNVIMLRMLRVNSLPNTLSINGYVLKKLGSDLTTKFQSITINMVH